VAESLQVLGEVALDEKPAASPPAGLEVLGEEDLPRETPASQVDRALRSVPRPNIPVEPVPLVPAVSAAGRYKPIGEGPMFGPGGVAERTIEDVTGGFKTLVPTATQPYPKAKEALVGAGKLVGGLGTLSLPLGAEAAVTSPLRLAAGYGTGIAAAKGAGKTAEHFGAEPETREAIENLAFWAPALAGTLFGLHGGRYSTPESGEGVLANLLYKAGADLPKNPTEADISTAYRQALRNIRDPQNPANDPELAKEISMRYAEHKARQGQNAQPEPAAPAAPPDPAASAMAQSQAQNAAATRVAKGLPPVPPAPSVVPPPGPPVPPEVAAGHISAETVSGIAKLLAGLPPELRAKGIIEAHETLTRVILQQGKIVGPDGKLSIVENEKQASSLAQQIINDEVVRQEKDFARVPGEGAGKAGAAPAKAEAAPSSIAEGITAARAGKPKLEVLGETELPEGELERGSATATTAENVPQIAPQQPSEGARKEPSPTEQAGAGGVHRGTAELPQERQTGKEVPSLTVLGEEHLLKKGDQVTLPGGESGTVRYISDAIARVEVPKAGGGTKRVSIPPAKLKAVAPAAQPEIEKQAVTEAAKGDIIFARHGATKLDKEGGNETVAGWSKEPLDERGIETAKKLAASLKDSGVTQIVTSDLPRAAQTAEIVAKALNIPVKEDGRLRPQRIPETEGKQVKEIQPVRDYYKEHPDEVPAGGESINQAKARQDAALAEVEQSAKAGEKPLVVTHSTNLEAEFGEKPEPGGIISRNLEVQGGKAEAAKAALPPAAVPPPTASAAPAGAAAPLPGEPAPAIKKELARVPEKPAEVPPVPAPGPQPARPAERAAAVSPEPGGKEGTPTKYKFGSTQANIPADSEAAEALATARGRISKNDLAGNGKETEPHVTVRYGIQGEDTAGIKKYLASLAPFEATLGKTEKFEPNEHTEGSSVIIAPIEAPELKKINKELEQHGDFKKPDFEYRPHATVAYVKPEVADRYVGMNVTEGKKFTVNQIAITDKQGKQEVVKLGGAAPKKPNYITAQEGSWFTKDKKVAQSYGPMLLGVDVPEDVAKATDISLPGKSVHSLPEMWRDKVQWAGDLPAQSPIGMVRLYRGINDLRFAPNKAAPGETKPATAETKPAKAETKAAPGETKKDWATIYAEKKAKTAAKNRKSEQERQAIIAEAYKPGNVVRGYTGYDKVIAFHPAEEGAPYPKDHWSVDVVASDKEGNPLSGERIRTHMTPPEKSDYLAAQKRLEARKAAPAAAEKPAEPAPTPPPPVEKTLEESVAELEAKRKTDPIADFLIKTLDKAFEEKRGGVTDAQYAVQRYANSGWVSPANRAEATKVAASPAPKAQAAAPPTSDVPVAGVEKVTPKADEQFEKDVKKRAAQLREKIAKLEKETAAPAAYYQDATKNAVVRDYRNAQIKQLSDAQNELANIELANPHELKPPDPTKLPDPEKNKYAFMREYFVRSLQPAVDAWKVHLGDKYANAVKNGMKGTNQPPDFPEKQLLVDIPGDGHFRVNNDPKVLDKAIRGAARGFGKPSFERQGPPRALKPSTVPTETAKWNYLDRMAEEAHEGQTQAEKDAALETIENILGTTPLRVLPKPGTTVSYRGEKYLVNGWEREYRRSVNLVPLDSPVGKQTLEWLKAGSPEMTKAESEVMRDRVRDAEEPAPLYLLQHVADPPEAVAAGKLGGVAPVTAQELAASESGIFEPRKLGEAVKPITDYLKGEIEANKIARQLHSGMYDLEAQYSGQVLRAVQAMEKANAEYGKDLAGDAAPVYDHLENPEEPLTPTQEKLLDETVLPIMDQTDEMFIKLKQLLGTDDPTLLENYVHRVVRNKGGWFDRILAGVRKGTGRGNLLSKSAPQAKGRTMMALENAQGDRKVVSIKGGQVTAWEHGTPENLGGISQTDEGRVFEDKDGTIWNLVQATTKEIEEHTNLEYYHNALASALVSNLQVGKALRGAEFIDSFKTSPEFKEIAFPASQGNPPEGWKMTQLPQLREYYFEPHTAEVLDWYAERLRRGDPGIAEKVGQFLRTSIFFNPLIHIPNITAHWLVERGLSGYNPLRFGPTYRSSVKAINAVIHPNQDFLDALDAGAALQSHREDTAKVTQLFFEQLSGGLESKEPWALEIARRIGMSPVDLVKGIYRFSGKATWVINDIAVLQSAYEKVDRGMPLKEALKETAKHIPDYRLPVRMFNSRGLAKILSNPNVSMFMAYHYGAAKSYGEAAKSALGLSEPATGRSKAGEVAHGWELLTTIGLLTFVLYPLLDQLVREASGDEKAHLRRAGPATIPYNIYQAATKQKSVGDVIQATATPAVGTKTAVEVLANRDLYTGRNIYDPTADAETQVQQVGRKLAEAVSPIGQGSRMMEGGREGRKRFAWSLAGVSFPKSRSERMAQQIALRKSGTQAQTLAERDISAEHRTILDELRKGNDKPLEKALDKRELTAAQASELRMRARRSSLEDTVHGFSYAEVWKVYQAAKADNDQAAMEQLERVLGEKRANMFAKHRGAEVEKVEAVQ
jgi:2,3-bisphosphoglycerate-dependent phosphoglycerate mutase